MRFIIIFNFTIGLIYCLDTSAQVITVRHITDEGDTLNSYNTITGKQGKWIREKKGSYRIDYYKNNLLNGYSTIYYKRYTVKLKYLNGRLIDTVFTYDKKGRIEELKIVMDTIYNTCIYFYRNGNISIISKDILFNGQLCYQCWSKFFYRNGQIKFLEWICKDSIGISKEYSRSGKIKSSNKGVRQSNDMIRQLLYPGFDLEACDEKSN